MKLVVVEMEYIFIPARNDLITEKKYEMKNPKENKCKEMAFREVLMHLFIDKKNLTSKKTLKKNMWIYDTWRWCGLIFMMLYLILYEKSEFP